MPLGHGGIDGDLDPSSASSSYTDEQAMDAVGAALRSTSTVVAVYNDASDTISFSAIGYPTDTITVPKVTVLTATTTSVFTVTVGTQRIIVEVVGGGGGGGSSSGSSTQASGNSGGASGGYAQKVYTTTATAYSYRVGEGGAPAAGTDGASGGTSTFENAAILVRGGGGGQAMALGTAVTVTRGGVSGSTPTGGNVINSGGAMGAAGIRGSASSASGGGGGPGPWGGSGTGAGGNTAGGDANGPGAGGGGAVVTSQNNARLGGTGADGVIIVTEYVKE